MNHRVCRVAPFDGSGDRWARLVSLSDSVVGLLTAVPFGPGTQVRVTLAKSDYVLEAQVVYADEQSPGCFFVVAEFLQPLVLNALAEME